MRNDVEDLAIRLEKSMQEYTNILLDCEEESLDAAPSAAEWSPIEVFGHIKALDDIITYRIASTVTQDTPQLVNFDTDAWEQAAGYTDSPLDQTLMAFARHRSEMIWQMRHFADSVWDRKAIHPIRGEVTLIELVEIFTKHEEEHLEQLKAIFVEN